MALQDTALRLIRKFGEERTVQLLQPNASPADPTKPWEVDPTSSESGFSVPAVVIPIRQSLVDGNSVRAGDQVALIAGLSLGTTVPTSADKILDEGNEKAVVGVDRIRPGKTDFLWKLQIRSAG